MRIRLAKIIEELAAYQDKWIFLIPSKGIILNFIFLIIFLERFHQNERYGSQYKLFGKILNITYESVVGVIK